MTDIFRLTNRPSDDLFYRKNDANDLRLGDLVSAKLEDYAAAEIVIVACPQDEGVRRSNGRIGASLAPGAIRKAFYKLTNFNISAAIFDLGNTIISETLEETHNAQTEIVRQLLKDKKKIIILGGGNDISYPDCKALALENSNLLAFNIDAHFDVRADSPRNSGTPYRQLLEEKLIAPSDFYEIAWQEFCNSPVYFDYLVELGVNLISLNEFRQLDDFNLNVLKLRNDKALFWGFDVDAVRSSDAPGVSAPNPTGLLGDEFCDLAAVAGFQENTKIIEFTEVNPNFDSDGRTAKLVATAMHRFCAAVSMFNEVNK